MNYTQLSKLENGILTCCTSGFEYMRATYAMAAACERAYLNVSNDEQYRINTVHHEINENRSKLNYQDTGEGITWV